MLIARVVTSAGNVSTITNLINSGVLTRTALVAGTGLQLSGANGANYLINDTLNWARTATTHALSIVRSTAFGGATDDDVNVMALGPTRTNASAVNLAPTVIPITRYGLEGIVMRDGTTELIMQFDARA
jgi:hypothetical protein